MSHVTEYTFPAHYYLGRSRRDCGESNIPPATAGWVDRHWWLAGWSDRDIELREAGK